MTILTKNPLLAARQGYVDLFRALSVLPLDHPRYAEFAAKQRPCLQVHVSLAFWQDESRAMYDPFAPTVAERIDGILALKDAGIPIVLRIDPLFPRSPLPLARPKGLNQFGLVEAQPLDDLDCLVDFARSVAVSHIVYSPLKIVLPRGRRIDDIMKAMLAVYQALAAPGKPVWHGLSWRLPPSIAREHVINPFLHICQQADVQAKYCMQDLIDIP